jgi:cell division protein FtsQ
MSEKAKIRRGAQPRHSRPVTQPPRRGPQARPGRAAAAIAALPTPPAKAKAAFRWLATVAAGCGLLAGLVALQVPQMMGTAIGEALGSAGLVVRRVEITGISRMDRLTVYSAALDQKETAMPLVDLAAIRAKLLRFGWVQDARVSRRLPDTLLIDIVERAPAAIWQHQGRLTLIDKAGVPLAPVDPTKMPDLPLLVGGDANMQAAALGRLMAAAPSLKPIWSGAGWIGGRRWDVYFQSGETLALPEGQAESEAAIAKFARMDQAAGLLGKGFIRFDMRVPGKFYVRTTTEPGKTAAPITPPTIAPAPAAPGVIDIAPPAGAVAARDAV